MNSYELSRRFFDWCFENPEKVSSHHVAIYFFSLEHNNRLGWKEKFGFPTQMVMDAIGIKKAHTYIRYFNDLCSWGFFKLVQRSSNQYSANIISLKSAMPKNGKALDKAMIRHAAKHMAKQGVRHRAEHVAKQMTYNKTKNKEQGTMNHEQGIPPYFDFENFVIAKINSADYDKIKSALKLKYESWVENGWKDGNDKKIKNWKSKILNTIPYLKNNYSNGKAIAKNQAASDHNADQLKRVLEGTL